MSSLKKTTTKRSQYSQNLVESLSMPKPQTEVERQRIRHRLQTIVFFTVIAVGFAWFLKSQATTTILFVRHAEQTQPSAEDPPLSDAGRRRVAELTRQLLDVNVMAGIDAIYSTPLKRSEETVRPLAEALDLPISSYDPADTEQVLETILKTHKGKIILVVGHSNTVPQLVANLDASKNVPPIARGEFDNIYIVSIPWFGKIKTIRLRYGDPYVASEGDDNIQPMIL
jgi:broad specificity phosphatase PhoE